MLLLKKRKRKRIQKGHLLSINCYLLACCFTPLCFNRARSHQGKTAFGLSPGVMVCSCKSFSKALPQSYGRVALQPDSGTCSAKYRHACCCFLFLFYDPLFMVLIYSHTFMRSSTEWLPFPSLVNYMYKCARK